MVLVITMFAVGILAQAQEPNTEYVRIVTAGEIRKIDQKNKTFQFKITLDRPARGGFNRPSGNPGGGRAGRGGRGGGRRGGGGGGGGGPFPAGNPPNTPDSIEVKVFVMPNTLLRGYAGFNFSNLKSGQHVSVTGVHRGTGNEIDAIEIDQ